MTLTPLPPAAWAYALSQQRLIAGALKAAQLTPAQAWYADYRQEGLIWLAQHYVTLGSVPLTAAQRGQAFRFLMWRFRDAARHERRALPTAEFDPMLAPDESALSEWTCLLAPLRHASPWATLIIDQHWLAGIPLTTLAATYQVDRSTLSRHRQHLRYLLQQHLQLEEKLR